jgi:isopenicillin-N N-acyltransferase-like protein
MSLPVVELAGDAYAQGLAHGRALAAEIAHNLRVYLDRFEREAKLARADLLARSGQYMEALGGRAPDYRRGMAGIAAGAGQPFDLIAMLNLRYELLYYQYGTVRAAEAAQKLGPGRSEPDGCTAFALLPEATAAGRLLVGQNWDWIPEARGALLRVRPEAGPARLGFTEAGIFGTKIGCNAAGVALAINGMLSTTDDWARFTLPFHWRCDAVLGAASFAAALAVIADEPRACTTNYLIAQAPGEVLDLEAAPDALGRVACRDGCLAHANHFEDPAAIGVVEPPSLTRPFSRGRAARLDALLREGRPVTLAALQAMLRDHENRPNSVCRHQDEALPAVERVHTVASVIMDPGAGRLWATDGPPCAGEYQELALA